MCFINVLLSGKVVPKKDVTEVIQRFNIQVNNLTQVRIMTCNQDILLMCFRKQLSSTVYWC